MTWKENKRRHHFSILIHYYLHDMNNIHHTLIPISMQIKQHRTHSDPNSITASSNIFLQSQRCTALLANKSTRSTSSCLRLLLTFCCSAAWKMIQLWVATLHLSVNVFNQILDQCFTTLVLRGDCPACFTSFPALTFLIQMIPVLLNTVNHYLNQACWSRDSS